MKTVQYNESYLPELINTSRALNDVQKEWMLKNKNQIPETKKRKIYDVLVNEQMKLYDINKRRIAANSEYLQKKTKITNTYNEQLGTLNEKNVLHQLDSELDSIFNA